MRCSILIAASLTCLVIQAPLAAESTTDFQVTARLESLEPAPGCGVTTFGSTATYRVLTGTSMLVGQQIKVLVFCIELPRTTATRESGDLNEYKVGAVHFLALTKRNVHAIQVPSSLPAGDNWFYVKAASLRSVQALTEKH